MSNILQLIKAYRKMVLWKTYDPVLQGVLDLKEHRLYEVLPINSSLKL